MSLIVAPRQTLPESPEQAEVRALTCCQRGECGLCAIDALQVQGDIDHRDMFFSPVEQRAGAKLCACVSRPCATGGTAKGGSVLVLDSAYRPDALPAAAPV